ncbi:MAG: hypothetical protein KAH54_09485 [Candidatus Sabulitectum sp.]|nr:hypothetical protein [Candidatus Sabulitectum sp.]
MKIFILTFSFLLLFTASATATLPSSETLENSWNYSSVDSAGAFGWLSMELDIWDLPHLAYEKDDQIWYAHRNAGSWEWEKERISLIGWRPCIALGPDQNPRIVNTQPGNMLAISTWNGSEWLVEEYSDFGRLMVGPVMAISPDGTVHLAYYTMMNGFPYELRYAVNDGEGWLRLELEYYGDNTAVTPMSIVLDSSGNPRVAGIEIYIDDSDMDQYFLNLYERGDTPGAWETNTIASFYCRGRPALAVAPGEISTLAYKWIDSEGSMRYHQYPGTWSDVYSLGDYPSMAFDSQGRPHLAFDAGTSTMYATRQEQGAAWELTSLPYSVSYWGLELEIDQSDHPHIALNRWDELAYVWWGDPTGIESEDQGTAEGLIQSFSPSPASETLSVSLNSLSSGRVDVRLVDITGRVMDSSVTELNGQNSSSVCISLKDFPNGVYVITAVQGSSSDRATVTVLH